MKKIYTFIFAALAFAASCTPSVEPDGEGNPPIGSQVPIIMKSYTITATKDADTKVSVADNGTQVTSVKWEEGDAIRVYNTDSSWDANGYEATLTSGAGKSSATFTFEAPEDRESGFFVVYGTTATLEDGKVYINVPAIVPGTAKPILAGYTNAEGSIGSVDLQAVCAYMKVTLKEPVDAVRFFAVNNGEGERLAGTVTFGTKGIVSTTPASESILTVNNPPNNPSNNPSTTFYVNILPCTLSQGYIIDVVKGSEHMIKSASYNSEKTFAPSFVKLALPKFTPVTVSGTLTPKTTYSEKDNTLANRLRIYDASVTGLTKNDISTQLADCVQFANYTCKDKDIVNVSTSGTFSEDFTIGEHTVAANYKFVCGGVTIDNVAALTAPAYITGLPYKSDFANNSNEWSYSQNAMKKDANGVHFYTATGQPVATLKNKFIIPETTNISFKADFYKEDKWATRNSELKATLGSITLSTTNKGNTSLSDTTHSLKGEIELKCSFGYSLANTTADAAINNIVIEYRQ